MTKRQVLFVGWTFSGRLAAVLLVMSMAGLGAFAQTPQSQGKATELLVAQYEKLISRGALLTPEGWRRAAKLFDQSDPYPQTGVIFLTSTGGSLGEMWLKGNRAQVETKWTDYFGSIDSALRYKPPEGPHVTMTSYDFQLVFSNGEWKIEGPLRDRWATVNRAILYVRAMHDKSSDAVIKKNANETIAILKRLNSQCGSASAC